mmetsp:Transcript_22182/g.42331  ORF Transcript_22182/g.42331 Transcript_22182/m.42331 type:complete len:83 (+) Transcript_22182:448-696(+)
MAVANNVVAPPDNATLPLRATRCLSCTRCARQLALETSAPASRGNPSRMFLTGSRGMLSMEGRQMIFMGTKERRSMAGTNSK